MGAAGEVVQREIAFLRVLSAREALHESERAGGAGQNGEECAVGMRGNVGQARWLAAAAAAMAAHAIIGTREQHSNAV